MSDDVERVAEWMEKRGPWGSKDWDWLPLARSFLDDCSLVPREALARVERERDAWEATAEHSKGRHDYHAARAETAESELAQARGEVEALQIAHDEVLGSLYQARERERVLAEAIRVHREKWSTAEIHWDSNLALWAALSETTTEGKTDAD